MEAVTLVSQTHMPDIVYDEVRQHFSEAELVNLTLAVGIINALPVSIDRVSQWIKGAETRGFVLVPITAATTRPKAS